MQFEGKVMIRWPSEDLFRKISISVRAKTRQNAFTFIGHATHSIAHNGIYKRLNTVITYITL